VSQALGPATWSLLPPAQAWQGAGVAARALARAGQAGQASTHAPLVRFRPRRGGVRRLRAAGRVFSEGVVLAGAGWRRLSRRPPRLATWEITRSTFGRYFL